MYRPLRAPLKIVELQVKMATSAETVKSALQTLDGFLGMITAHNSSNDSDSKFISGIDNVDEAIALHEKNLVKLRRIKDEGFTSLKEYNEYKKALDVVERHRSVQREKSTQQTSTRKNLEVKTLHCGCKEGQCNNMHGFP